MQIMTTPSGRDTDTKRAAGRHLAELRRSLGMTQEGLADAIGAYLGADEESAGQRAVSTWERGTRRPSIPNLAAIAAITKTDPADLLERWYPELAAATLDNVTVMSSQDHRTELVHVRPQAEAEQLRGSVQQLVGRVGRRATDADLNRIVDAMLALPKAPAEARETSAP